MAEMVTPCGERLTVNEFARHIMICARCLTWWTMRRKQERSSSRGRGGEL